MARNEYGSRVVVGVVTARSSSEPSKAVDLVYEIEVDDDGLVMVYPDVKPGKGWRPTDTEGVDPETLYMPFLIGQRLPVGIESSGAVDTVTIMAREHINMLPCEDEETQP